MSLFNVREQPRIRIKSYKSLKITQKNIPTKYLQSPASEQTSIDLFDGCCSLIEEFPLESSFNIHLKTRENKNNSTHKVVRSFHFMVFYYIQNSVKPIHSQNSKTGKKEAVSKYINSIYSL